MTSLPIFKGQSLAIDGLRYDVIEIVRASTSQVFDGSAARQAEEGPVERVVLRDLLTRGKRILGVRELQELYVSHRLRLMSFAETHDVVPGETLVLQLEDLSDAPQVERDEVRFKVACVQAIAGIPSRKKGRKALTAALGAVAARFGRQKPASLASVYRWRATLREWDGDPRGLLERHAHKGNRNDRMAPEIRLIVEECLKRLYLKLNPASLRKVHEEVLVRLRAENLRRAEHGTPLLPSKVSYVSVKRLADRIEPYAKVKAQEGYITAERKFRRGGRSPTVDRPLQRVEVDHTQLDVYIVSDVGNIPVGRPWLTAAIDVYSRAILGIHLSFKAPNQHSIAQCLRSAILPKDLSRFSGIKSEWPMYGIPCELVHDGGKDFIGKMLSDAAFHLGIQLNGCPVLRPWLKGTIERFYHTLNDGLINILPGRVIPTMDRDGPKDYKPKKDAVLTFRELEFVLTLWIADHYHHDLHSSLLDTPANVWNSGIASAPQRIPASRYDLDIFLARKLCASASGGRIKFLHLVYTDEKLVRLSRKVGKEKVTFRLNDDDLSNIFVFDPEERKYFQVPCAQQELARGVTLQQWEVIRTLARQRAQRIRDVNTERLMEAKESIRAFLLQQRALGQATLGEEVFRGRTSDTAGQSTLPPSAFETMGLAPEQVPEAVPAKQPEGISEKPADKTAPNLEMRGSDLSEETKEMLLERRRKREESRRNRR